MARIYKEENKFEEAIKEYSSLAKGKTNKEKCLAYCEIIKIALKISDQELIKKYYEKCKNIVSDYTDSDLEFLNIFCTLARGAHNLGKLKDAKSYYMEALVIGRSLKNMEEERINIIGELFDVLDKSDFYSAQSIELEYLDLIKSKSTPNITLKILNYYKNILPNELPYKLELFLK